MNRWSWVVILFTGMCVFAQVPAGFDPRLSVSTLVREDLFAGFLTNDLARFSVGVKNLDTLLKERPAAKPVILAWQASAAMYYAIRAADQQDTPEFDKQYKRVNELLRDATAADPANEGVAAIQGAIYALFGDRLPEKYRAEAAAKSYEGYLLLSKLQAPMLEKLPLHHKGELLSGLAHSAQRTGRVKETSEYLDRIIATLPGTPYATRAAKWKESPEVAGRSSMVCMTCHDAGRLETRRAALAAQR